MVEIKLSMYSQIQIAAIFCVPLVLCDYPPFKLVQYKEDTDIIRAFRYLDLDYQNCSYYKEQGKSDQILFYQDENKHWSMGKIKDYLGISSLTECPRLNVTPVTPANIFDFQPCINLNDIGMKHENLQQQIFTLTEEDCWNYVQDIASPIIGNGFVFMTATRTEDKDNEVLCKYLLTKDAMNSTFSKEQFSNLRLHHKRCPKTWSRKSSPPAGKDNSVWVSYIVISVINMILILALPVATIFWLKSKGIIPIDENDSEKKWWKWW